MITKTKNREEIEEFVNTNQPKRSEIKKIKNIIKGLDLKGVFSLEEIKSYTNFYLIFGKKKTKQEIKEHFVLKNILKNI